MGQERITTKIASFAIYLYSAFHYSKIPSFQPLLLPAAGGLLPAVFLHALCLLVSVVQFLKMYPPRDFCVLEP